jgi:hypothetical protein
LLCISPHTQEIEKIQDIKALWSLHMPWEKGELAPRVRSRQYLIQWLMCFPDHSGRCPVETGRPAIDVSKVIWVATSNICDRFVLEHEDGRQQSGQPLDRTEYVNLMKQARQQVSEHLGVSEHS